MSICKSGREQKTVFVPRIWCRPIWNPQYEFLSVGITTAFSAYVWERERERERERDTVSVCRSVCAKSACFWPNHKTRTWTPAGSQVSSTKLLLAEKCRKSKKKVTEAPFFSCQEEASMSFWWQIFSDLDLNPPITRKQNTSSLLGLGVKNNPQIPANTFSAQTPKRLRTNQVRGGNYNDAEKAINSSDSAHLINSWNSFVH